ncbi:IS110 family transposase [Xenorhabdus eapokensis]|uniref:IS110 family transposase n=2 Tax=Xenorhabdus eapokensis TaxID=1873482 RepID=A0A1Q5TBH7_9GAMM|nr:IS110 family transposase [Xenorhabdus eapokensis]
MNKGKIIGIDLAKTHFYLFTLDKEGHPAGKKRLSRGELLSLSTAPNYSRIWSPSESVIQSLDGGMDNNLDGDAMHQRPWDWFPGNLAREARANGSNLYR